MRWVALCALMFLPAYASPDDCRNGCTVESREGHFTLGATPGPDGVPLREHHDWIIQVKDRAGDPVRLNGLAVSGGMPGHGHGLPTQPVVSEYLGKGRYRVTGFLFNMHGDWILRFQLTNSETRDIAELPFSLDY